nr:MAG TPA: hypothetical protein [Caudoviricetes sp.]
MGVFYIRLGKDVNIAQDKGMSIITQNNQLVGKRG